MSSATLSPEIADCLPRAEAAAYIRVKPSTLAFWAHTGKYRDLLPFGCVGKRAYYRIADLDRFVKSRFPSGPAK
jgi:hypothetical protein